MIEHREPTPNTQKNVLAASGNLCAFPDCSRLIFDLQHETLIGTVAHIHARKVGGPRFDPNQSEKENRSFANLVAMCAEHSKIIDGSKWRDFSPETLRRWKNEHEQMVAKKADRNWIKRPNATTLILAKGKKIHVSFWYDSTGRPRLFEPEQLAIVNTLASLKQLLLKLIYLPETLKSASRNTNVASILQQNWAQFEVDESLQGDLTTLMAMAANVTFAEFLGFVIDGEATSLIQKGASRITSMANGSPDSLVKRRHRTDAKS